MRTRVTINCPDCSAVLSAPVSAAGKSLLCPKCRAAIPVPELPEAHQIDILKSANALDQSHHPEPQTVSIHDEAVSSRRRGRKVLAVGLCVSLIFGLILVGASAFYEWNKSRKIATALHARNFDRVLALDPNHVESLIGRIDLRLKAPEPDVHGAENDLQHLQKIAPQHPIHKSILPELSIARSMDLAAAGRISAAIEELTLARSLGSPDHQWNRVKDRISTLFLQQIKESLAEENFDRAISECAKFRSFAGDNVSLIAYERAALCGAAETAVSEEETVRIIDRLEALDNGLQLAETSGPLRSLYLKRLKQTHSNRNLSETVDLYTKLVSYGGRDSESLELGIKVTDAAIVALESDHSATNLQRARSLIDLLEEHFDKTASVLKLKIRLADRYFSDSTPRNRNEALDYAELTMHEAQAFGVVVENIEGKGDFRSRISAALMERGLSHLRSDRIDEGGRDFEAALKIFPEEKNLRLRQLHRLPSELLDRLPVSLRPQQANTQHDPILDLIPARTDAFSVVRNMQSFSDKVDDVASSMLLDRPRFLDAACTKSEIRDGLKRDGSLGWVHVPAMGDTVLTPGMLFYLPTSDFFSMIQNIRTEEPEKGQPLFPVTMNTYRGLAVENQSHGVFAFERDREHLLGAISGPKGIQDRLIPFELWDQDLDAYFVTTPQGCQHGFRSICIPFTDGYVHSFVDKAFQAALQSGVLSGQAESTVPTEIHQLAAGLAIQPNLGIAARSRIWLNPESDLARFFSENPGGREAALNQLPEEEFLIAVGGPVSAFQSGLLTDLPKVLSPGARALDIRINRVQAVVLAPGRVFAPEDGDEQLAEQPQADNPWGRLLNRTILVVTVDDSQTALAELKTLFVDDFGVVVTESGEIDHVPFLRVAQRLEVFGELQNLELCIATPNRESLVVVYGGDEQLRLALKPFRNLANLSKSPTIKAAVRMLPQRTSWLVAMDLRVLGEWLQTLRDHSPLTQMLVSTLIQPDETSLPLAAGASWQKSDFDLNCSLPVETLPLAGRIVMWLGLMH